MVGPSFKHRLDDPAAYAAFVRYCQPSPPPTVDDDYDAAWWAAQTPRLPAPPANYDDLVPLPPVPVAVYYANAWDAPERD